MKKSILVLMVLCCAVLLGAQNGHANAKIDNCLTCHSFPALGGLHTEVGHVNCTSCHAIPGDNATTPAKCAVCHPMGNPGECGLVNKHGSGDCATCHTDCASGCPAASMLGAEDARLAKLRDFRDSVLAQSTLGKKIISVYYNNADAINEALDNSPALKAVSLKALESFLPVLDLFL